MKKSRWFITSILLSLGLILSSCQSTAQDQKSENSTVETANTQKEAQSPLQKKLMDFYALFPAFPSEELTCETMISSTGLGKSVVREFVNPEVKDWSEEEWEETSYNAVYATKKSNYYIFAIEKEVPGSRQINMYTYDSNGIRQSNIPLCEESPGGEIKSRLDKDFSIFRVDEYGVSTYKLNSRGVYVKGQ